MVEYKIRCDICREYHNKKEMIRSRLGLKCKCCSCKKYLDKNYSVRIPKFLATEQNFYIGCNFIMEKHGDDSIILRKRCNNEMQ